MISWAPSDRIPPAVLCSVASGMRQARVVSPLARPAPGKVQPTWTRATVSIAVRPDGGAS
jgi:hypothetical protein